MDKGGGRVPSKRRLPIEVHDQAPLSKKKQTLLLPHKTKPHPRTQQSQINITPHD
jgi:hypothetical protein